LTRNNGILIIVNHEMIEKNRRSLKPETPVFRVNLSRRRWEKSKRTATLDKLGNLY
jgi:hypothetical protein